MPKHIVTKKDLKDNPELKEKGIKEGDEIDIPDQNERDGQTPQNDDDTGGSQPPPNKGRG